MSNSNDRYLYYKDNLYQILKEDTNNYYLKKCHKKFSSCESTPIHFKPDTDRDYNLFLRFDCEYNHNYLVTKLLDKNQEDYIIVDEIYKHNDILVITRTNNILEHKVIWESQLENYNFFYKLKYIFDNFRQISTLQNEIRGQPHEHIYYFYKTVIRELNREYLIIQSQIRESVNKDDILNFLEGSTSDSFNYKEDRRELNRVILSRDFDSDTSSDSDNDISSDSDNDTSFINSSSVIEDKPILTETKTRNSFIKTVAATGGQTP